MIRILSPSVHPGLPYEDGQATKAVFPWIMLLGDDGSLTLPSRYVEGFAIVRRVPWNEAQCCTYAFIDQNGNRGVPGDGESAEPFHDGLAITDKGYIDKTGNVVIARSKITTDSVHLHEFEHRLARVVFTSIPFESGTEPWGYIDRNGQLIWGSH